MSFFLLAAIGQAIMKLLLIVVAVFLILLVLVQRGRGGGLAGALGGTGGSSAFGAKAGDVFTKITVIAAGVWIVLCLVAVNMGPSNESQLNTGGKSSVLPPLADGPALISAGEEEAESGDESSEADASLGEDLSSDGGEADSEADDSSEENE